MIFISGIHGVGKTYFCSKVKEELNIESYSASQLISQKKGQTFLKDKLVENIDDNQHLLLEALKDLRHNKKEFILDGHFCLLDSDGEITRIPNKTFYELRPDSVILLTEKPEIIAARRLKRDGISQEINEIQKFQNAEENYAAEISQTLDIPFVISNGAKDLGKIIEFIKLGGHQNGRKFFL